MIMHRLDIMIIYITHFVLFSQNSYNLKLSKKIILLFKLERKLDAKNIRPSVSFSYFRLTAVYLREGRKQNRKMSSAFQQFGFFFNYDFLRL